jgi:hypothetical protein
MNVVAMASKGKFEWLKACIVGVPLIALLLAGRGPTVSGPWWLELWCMDDQWSLWAVVPFHVEEDGTLCGEGNFVLEPTERNEIGTGASGAIEISGHCTEGGFDLDEIRFPEYEVGQSDSFNRRMTVFQLGCYETSWEAREALEDQMETFGKTQHAEIWAENGAEATFGMVSGGQVYLALYQGE